MTPTPEQGFEELEAKFTDKSMPNRPKWWWNAAITFAREHLVKPAIEDEAQNPWKAALLDGMLDLNSTVMENETPRQALNRLIDWEQKAALDLDISPEAQELVKQAVEAEREACAELISAEICVCCWDNDASAAAEHLAAVIRSRTKVEE